MPIEKFYLGMPRVGEAWLFDRTFISANRLQDLALSSTFIGCKSWVMDSGAFTEIFAHGRYRTSVAEYAELIRRFSRNTGLEAAVSQDWMCEDVILAKTGLTIADHQRLTIERYDELLTYDVGGVYIMPVIQGFAPEEYADHVRQYGDRLGPGAWVGVGSVCKRQGSPKKVVAVLKAILAVRGDLKLHGFGVKLTSLRDPEVCALLHSADSMAWSFAARKRNGDGNSLWVARQWEAEVLEAIGIEPGEQLAQRIRSGNITRFAGEDNARAARGRASMRRTKEAMAEFDRRMVRPARAAG